MGHLGNLLPCNHLVSEKKPFFVKKKISGPQQVNIFPRARESSRFLPQSLFPDAQLWRGRGRGPPAPCPPLCSWDSKARQSSATGVLACPALVPSCPL